MFFHKNLIITCFDGLQPTPNSTLYDCIHALCFGPCPAALSCRQIVLVFAIMVWFYRMMTKDHKITKIAY